MSTIVIIIVGIVLIVVSYLVYKFYFSSSQANNDILPKMTPLNSKLDILTADKVQSQLLSSAGSTVMGFFYLKDGDRTSKYSDSFIPIIQVDNNWFFEIAPSPSGKSHTTARLRVLTNDAGKLTEEIFELASIPKQKWVFLAILRDGRRFDVIYDNKIVGSQRLQYYPVTISSSLSVGNKGLDGSVIHVIINGIRITPTEVERERVKHVDTNNTVLEAKQLNVSMPVLNLFAQCPPGLPCDPITKPPNNNLFEWKTPYA